MNQEEIRREFVKYGRNWETKEKRGHSEESGLG